MRMGNSFKALTIILTLPIFIAGYYLVKYFKDSSFYWCGLEEKLMRNYLHREHEKYYIAMRGSHIGCSTYKYLRPSIAFIGDSHSYAGYDYSLLKKKVSSAVIGNCALSGMRPANVVQFINQTSKKGLKPRHLIFVISVEMFWFDETRRVNLTQRVGREIQKIGEPKESIFRLLSENHAISTKINDSNVFQSTPDFLERIKDLKPANVDHFLSSYDSGIHELDW